MTNTAPAQHLPTNGFSRRRLLTQAAVGTIATAPLLSGCGHALIDQAIGAALASTGLQEPTFGIEGFGVESLSINQQTLIVNTSVTNPNNVQITINSLELAVSLANVDFGQAQTSQPFVVPANGTVVVPLRWTTNVVAALVQSVGILNIRLATQMPYSIVGQANVSQLGIPVPINLSGTVTPQQIIGLAQFLRGFV